MCVCCMYISMNVREGMNACVSINVCAVYVSVNMYICYVRVNVCMYLV